MRSLPAKAVGQPCTVEPDGLVQLVPRCLLPSGMDAHVRAALAVPLQRRGLERGGAEEEVSLAQEVAQALCLGRGLGVALTVLDLAHGTRSTVGTDVSEGRVLVLNGLRPEDNETQFGGFFCTSSCLT